MNLFSGPQRGRGSFQAHSEDMIDFYARDVSSIQRLREGKSV